MKAPDSPAHSSTDVVDAMPQNNNNHQAELDDIKLSIDQLVKATGPELEVEKADSIFKRIVLLKPHGNELITTNAAAWLFITRIIVFLMASAEAFSWGYLGHLLVEDRFKYVSALVVGTIIFLIVWGSDVTLMTLDRSRSYQEKIFGEAEQKLGWAWAKDLAGIIARVIIVTLSLFITAPFLSQLVFNAPIENEIEKQTNQIISEKRNKLVEAWDKKINDLGKQLEDDHKQLEDELAGRRKSKLYGDGPVAKAIREKIQVKQATYDSLKSTPTQELVNFDELLRNKNYDLLSKNFGLSLPKNDIQERNVIISKILQTGEAQRTELTIQAFLLFLFLSLLILKVFEPRGIRIYFSEALHQAWKGYVKGTYDQWVPIDEKWGGRSPMEPYRFEDFMINTYAKRREEDEKQKLDSAFNVGRQQLNQIIFSLQEEREKEIERIRPIVQPLQAELIKTQEQVALSSRKVITLNHQIKQKEDMISKIDKNLADLGSSNKFGNHSYKTVADIQLGQEIAEMINAAQREAEVKKEELEKLVLERNTEQTILASLEGMQKGLEKKIADLENYAGEIELKIRTTTKIAVEKYAERAITIAQGINSDNKDKGE